MDARRFLTTLSVFAVYCRVSAFGTALTFNLPDKTKTCFGERFEGPKLYVFDFRVLKGGKKDIDAYVKSPNGKLLFRKQMSSQGKFKFETSRGDYSFCFSNEFSTISHKLVYFDLKPVDRKSLAVEAGVEKPSVQTAFEASCDEVHDKMTTVVDYQRDYRLKESIGRHLAEGLHRIVTWWSVGQTIVVMLAGFGQVFLLKRFFTEKVADYLIKEET